MPACTDNERALIEAILSGARTWFDLKQAVVFERVTPAARERLVLAYVEKIRADAVFDAAWKPFRDAGVEGESAILMMDGAREEAQRRLNEAATEQENHGRSS